MRCKDCKYFISFKDLLKDSREKKSRGICVKDPSFCKTLGVTSVEFFVTDADKEECLYFRKRRTK